MARLRDANLQPLVKRRHKKFIPWDTAQKKYMHKDGCKLHDHCENCPFPDCIKT